MGHRRPMILIILDGFGTTAPGPANAVTQAKTPVLDRLKKEAIVSSLHASGYDVGLPEGQMGNSEVGHLNIGAGRIMYQNLTRITRDIEEGSFFKNEAFLEAMEKARLTGRLHLMGLVSKGGVHSHMDHLKGLIAMAKREEVPEVFIHAFTDGRDVAPESAYEDLQELQDYCATEGVGTLATVCGRYYAMDRDNRWERTEMAYRGLVYGEGRLEEDLIAGVKKNYEEGVTDEFLPMMVKKGLEATIRKEDPVIFFNFRPDRARQITRAIVDEAFAAFERADYTGDFVTMTQYDVTIPHVKVAYHDIIPEETLGQYLSEQGKTQLRIAETEKYAHVTFFLNGGIEAPYPGEERILVPSPKVATYDLKPEMSAIEVTDKVVEQIEAEHFDFIMLNFANPDMVGHTGVLSAAIKAVETVDTCLGRILEALDKVGGAAIITADHGNCEVMFDESGPVTSHTTNIVPLYGYGFKGSMKEGRLADLAPTILTLMGLEVPVQMSGENLWTDEEVEA